MNSNLARHAGIAALLVFLGVALARVAVVAAFPGGASAERVFAEFETEAERIASVLEESYVDPAAASEARFVSHLAASLDETFGFPRGSAGFSSPAAVAAAARPRSSIPRRRGSIFDRRSAAPSTDSTASRISSSGTAARTSRSSSVFRFPS